MKDHLIATVFAEKISIDLANIFYNMLAAKLIHKVNSQKLIEAIEEVVQEMRSVINANANSNIPVTAKVEVTKLLEGIFVEFKNIVLKEYAK